MRLPIVLLLLLSLSNLSEAQFDSDEMYVSPGIKIGWASGDEGGFTIGFELSVIQMARDWSSVPSYYGLVFDYDFGRRGRHKFHMGVEAGVPLVGVEMGPTLIVGREKTQVGLTMTPYIGLIAYPYYSINLADTVIQEAGAYLKLPYSLRRSSSGSRFN